MGFLSSIVVTPVALASDNDSSNMQFKQTISLSLREKPEYVLEVMEGKDSSFTVTVKIDSMKIKDEYRPRCYPASTCYNPPKDKFDLPIGQSKAVIDYIKHADIPKYYLDTNGHIVVDAVIDIIVHRFIGGRPGTVVDFLVKEISKSTETKNAQMKSWANDPSLQGMKISTTIAHMYNGYSTSITYEPWK